MIAQSSITPLRPTDLECGGCLAIFKSDTSFTAHRRGPAGARHCVCVLGLGPFGFLPATRRAPMVELAFVAKPITNHERRREEVKDAEEAHAHLAHMPINIEPNEGFSRIWKSTRALRLKRLGADNTSAKAKVTYGMPRTIWLQKETPALVSE